MKSTSKETVNCEVLVINKVDGIGHGPMQCCIHLYLLLLVNEVKKCQDWKATRGLEK